MSNRAPIAASGYEALASTPLGGGVVYAGIIRDRNWENDFIPYICNTQILSDLINCGQVIEFMKPPQVGAWRDYELDQALIPDQVIPESSCLSICNMKYKALKFDREDIRRACSHWDAFEEAFLQRCWEELSATWHSSIITDMIIGASTTNKGNKAGRHGNFKLGTITQPLALTPDSIINFLAIQAELFVESGRWYEGDMFMLVPPSFHTLILQSMFEKQWCCNLGDFALVKGFKANNLQGFNIIETSLLQGTPDNSTGKLVYPIVSGWSDAYGFAGDLVDAEITSLSGDSFGVLYKMLSVFGGGVIYPEALSVSYVTFSTNGSIN